MSGPAACCGAILYPPGDARGAGARRALSLPNPKHTAWLRHGKGPEPERRLSACGVMDGGPWAGGVWVPRMAPDWVGVGADRTTFPAAEPIAFRWDLRDYQAPVVDAVVARGGGGIIAPCGAGKTVMGCALVARHDTPALILVHTRDLAAQWVERVRESLGVEAEIVGYGKRTDGTSGRVVVASLQTLARWGWWRVHQWGQRFGLVIADECFPAGTPISMADGSSKPIEAVRPGDSVLAWLDGALVARNVTCTSVTEARFGVHLSVGDSEITCTEDHPFLTPGGWVKAGDLRCGDMVLLQAQEVNHDPSATVAHPGVHMVWDTGDASNKAPEGPISACGDGLLQSGLLERIPGETKLGDDGRNEPEVRIRTDAQAQPHEAARGSAARGSDTARDGAQTPDAGRKRQRLDEASNTTVSVAGARLGCGIRCEDRTAAGQRGVSASVQGGHSGPRAEDRNRGRWAVAQVAGEPEAGCQERRPPAVAGLDGHPGLEWRRIVRRERVRIDDHVYNFSVDEAETYVAGGFVVHNCHHVPAATWGAVMAGLSARVRVGLTATPERPDGLHPILYWHMGGAAAVIDPAIIEAAGKVLAPTIRRWNAPAVDLDGLEAHERARALAEDEARNLGLCVEAAGMVAAGRRVLLLTKLVDHCGELAERLRSMDIDAVALTGRTKPKERAATIDRMRAGSVQVVCATSLADEGLDAPRLDACILAAPEGNVHKVEQRIGRVCRPHPDGLPPVVVDVVDTWGPYQGYARRRRTLYQSRGWRVVDAPRPLE